MRYLSGIILITLLIPALAEKLHAQTYKFRQYGIEEGICHPFVYTVNQDKNGFIWLGTGEGLCKFDGFDFYGDFTTDSLPEAFVKKIYKDREGNLWLGHNDGNITFYDGQHFSIIEPDEKITSTINDITGDTLGNILFATQNQGVIRVNKRLETKNIKIPFQQKLLSSICFTPEGLLLVGAYDGLYLYEFDAENDTALLLSKVSQLPYTMVSAIEPAGFKNGYLIGTQDEGLYSLVLDENNRAEVFKLETESALKYTSVVDISRDSHNNVWLSTQGEGVYKITLANDGQQILSLTHFNDKNGLGSIFIRDVFEDLEGNIWICTYGNGLATLFDEAFVFYQYKDEMGSDIYSVEADDDGFWIGGAGKILKVSKEVELKTEIYGNSTGVPADNITALHLDGDNNLWIGTADKGLYRMDLRSEKVSKIYTSENSLENIINAIDGDENTLWVATNSGVVAIDKKTGQRRSYTTSDGLPHNKISDIFVDSKGNVWIATRSNGLFSVNQKIEYRISGNVVLEFIAITEDDNGNLWAATNNDGVFKFLADTPQHYSTYNGLKSAACYSIINDNHGNIWVGHRLGLSKINVGNAVVLTYGTETGISGDCYPNSVSLTSDGTVLFGTSDGLVTFNTRKERKNIHAPFLNITSLKISDRDYSIDKPIILPYGIYKVRVDFIGLNFRASDRVTYQYKLDGYDDWSEIF